MAESIHEIAARCLDDADYARKILEGEDYPEVRSAIIADLEDDNAVQGYLSGTGQGFLNPQPMPPSPATGYAKAQYYQPLMWTQWSTFNRVNLNTLALRVR